MAHKKEGARAVDFAVGGDGAWLGIPGKYVSFDTGVAIVVVQVFWGCLFLGRVCGQVGERGGDGHAF